MSYDVSIGKESFNYTSNVSALFYDHIPGWDKGQEEDPFENYRGGLHAIHGKTGKEAGDILSKALNEINRTRMNLWDSNVVGEPKLCAKYDALNGWGSLVGGLIFLTQIMATCYQNPRKRVSLSA